MQTNRIFVLGATRITVGLSTIIKVSASAYGGAYSMKILSGGGTLEIVPGASTNGTGWGTGYPMGASEVVNVSGPATFYLAATGATMVASMMIGNTAGATVI